MTRLLAIATLAAGASFVAAQSLSSGCTSALTSIVSNPDASACLNPSALVTLFIGSGNTSIVDPINNWLTGLCSSGPCSNATLASVTQNVTNGCSTELSALGLSSGSTDSIVTTVQQVYPTVRKVACLKDSNTLCVTETLTNLQNSLGPLSINNIVNIIAQTANVQLPANATCTNCIKEAYNIINQDMPSLVSDAQAPLQSECGTSFTDGTIPSGISQSASSASAVTSSSAALRGVSLSNGVLAGMGVSAMVTLSAALAFLA